MMTEKAEKETSNKKAQDVAENYAAAVKELEEILQDLSQNDVDVDDLTEKVRRGLELIKFCQAKIGETEIQVQEIVDSIEVDS